MPPMYSGGCCCIVQSAVGSLKSGVSGPDTAKAVLQLCDDVRNNVFPKLGVVAADSGTNKKQ